MGKRGGQVWAERASRGKLAGGLREPGGGGGGGRDAQPPGGHSAVGARQACPGGQKPDDEDSPDVLLLARSAFPAPRKRLLKILPPRPQGGHDAAGAARGSTDLQAGHAAERGGRVSEVDPLSQQIATVGEVQKTLPLLAPEVLTARVRHVPPDTRAAPGSAGRLRGDDCECPNSCG